MKTLRCAVIGHGMIGAEHARVLAAMPGVELCVMCDVRAEAASSIPAGARFAASLPDALDEPGLDAVWVCTPQHVHRPVVEAALARGLAVFCEKPISASLEDADAIIGAAQGKTLAVGHMLRFDPDYIEVSSQIATGSLGTVVQLAARRNCPDYEGRVISGRTSVPLELAIHDLDIFRWLAGPIEAVYAEPSPIRAVGPGPDAVVGTVRFASGAVGTLEHNWIMPASTGHFFDQRLAVFGTGGTAYVEGTTTQVYAARPGLSTAKYGPEVNGLPFGLLAAEDLAFTALVRDGHPWPLSLPDARTALVAALAMERSMHTGRRVRLAEIDPLPVR